MAALLPETGGEQVPSVDSNLKDEPDAKVETKENPKLDSISATADDTKPITEKSDTVADPSTDPVAAVEVEVESGQRHNNDDENLTFQDVQAAVDEIDENLDDAFGQAADSLWSFATSVTGKVSSVVKEQQGLETLRKNVTSRIPPLSNIGRDIQSQIVTLAPDEKSIANIAGSVKSVAETVQRNAVAMEEAILATANNTGDSNAGAPVGDRSVAIDISDPGVAIVPEVQQGADGLDDIATVGEKVSNAFEQTVGGLWSGLWGTGDGEVGDMGSKKSKIPKTRFGKRIFELQANPDTYCEPAEDLDAFEKWGKDFNLDNYEKECIELLYTHDSIAELYERVVPRVVEENTFWMRYFFAKHNLQLEEERRQKLLERAENVVEEADEDDDGWGDDDWDDEAADENKNDTRPAVQNSTQGPSHDDVNKIQESTTSSEEPGPQSKENQIQDLTNTGSEGSEKTSKKSETVHKGTKEQDTNNGEKQTVEVEVQDNDDDWGDDWE